MTSPIIPGDNDTPVPGNPGITQPVAATTGGAVPVRIISDGGQAAAAVQIKQNAATPANSAPGMVSTLSAFSIATTPTYLKLYDKLTAPTEADTPKHTYLIPGTTIGDGAGFVTAFPYGLQFDIGMWARLTTGLVDSDTGELNADEVIVNIGAR